MIYKQYINIALRKQIEEKEMVLKVIEEKAEECKKFLFGIFDLKIIMKPSRGITLLSLAISKMDFGTIETLSNIPGFYGEATKRKRN